MSGVSENHDNEFLSENHNSYTPTTEEVRNVYSRPYMEPDRVAQFDCWLAEVKAQAYDKAISALTTGPAELLEIRSEAVKAERQRIIKLLEDMCIDDYYCQEKGGCDCYDAEIALIKGETE